MAGTNHRAPLRTGENAALVVKTDPIEAGVGSLIKNIVSLTQVQYDALSSPQEDTLYVITE